MPEFYIGHLSALYLPKRPFHFVVKQSAFVLYPRIVLKRKHPSVTQHRWASDSPAFPSLPYSVNTPTIQLSAFDTASFTSFNSNRTVVETQ